MSHFDHFYLNLDLNDLNLGLTYLGILPEIFLNYQKSYYQDLAISGQVDIEFPNVFLKTFYELKLNINFVVYL